MLNDEHAEAFIDHWGIRRKIVSEKKRTNLYKLLEIDDNTIMKNNYVFIKLYDQENIIYRYNTDDKY